MKLSYRDFKRLFADGRLMEIQRFRMLFPDTYSRYYTDYRKEQGKNPAILKNDSIDSRTIKKSTERGKDEKHK